MDEKYLFKKTRYEYQLISSFIDPFTGAIISPMFIETPKNDLKEIISEKWERPRWHYFTNNFYISSYICPKCYSLLFKTVFLEDYPIHTTDGIKRIPRIFTCGECFSFHAPEPGYRLADNNGYILEFDDQISYEEFLYELDKYGSTIGRRGTIDNSKY
ncbi:MAG: hypothetical protein PWQ20_1281 [Thermotogaceae bacterium]|nr:hypothetical protein [Thermotogaceae bacterium]MDN5338211.1 hypothetical protein [Thermotogaceae bacterium]